MYRILTIRSKKRIIIFVVVIFVLLFIIWRVFVWSIDVTQTPAPAVLGNLSAKEYAASHQGFYNEWQTTIHSQA